MNKSRVFLIVGFIVIICFAIGGKMYMTNQEQIRQERNTEIKKIQKQASKYIIENYSGVKKIEWNGWSTGAGPLSIDTSMTINDYQDKVNGKVQFSYSAGYPEYVEGYTDKKLEVSPLVEDDPSKGVMQKTLKAQGVKKSTEGSPNAEIIYNWEERK